MDGPYLRYHEHRSRIPAALASLNERVESEADDDDGSSSGSNSEGRAGAESPVQGEDSGGRRRSSLGGFGCGRSLREGEVGGELGEGVGKASDERSDKGFEQEWRKLGREGRRLERWRVRLMERE